MLNLHLIRMHLWPQDRPRKSLPGKSRKTTRTESGFSLVEVMVAMVIGLLGIIVMMQMFSLFEGQKRTTGGGDDAINSGSISLYGIQRILQQSGWGSSAFPLIGCAVQGKWGFDPANPTVPADPTLTIPLVPVTIYPSTGLNITTPSGYPAIPTPDPYTDALFIVSGNGNGTVEGDAISSGGGTSYSVHTPTGFSVGDRVVVAKKTRPSSCSLALTNITGATAVNVPVTLATAPAITVETNDLLFNLGPHPTVRGYAIRKGNLTTCEYSEKNNNCAGDADSWVSIANNVVSMRAEYGKDTTLLAMDGIVDDWDQTALWARATWVGGLVSSNSLKDTQACALLRTAALRIVLVARNSQPEKTLDWPAQTDHIADHVFPDPRTWMGNPVITLPSPDPAWPTWKDFRYKTFQTVIPLRNITSQGVVTEC